MYTGFWIYDVRLTFLILGIDLELELYTVKMTLLWLRQEKGYYMTKIWILIFGVSVSDGIVVHLCYLLFKILAMKVFLILTSFILTQNGSDGAQRGPGTWLVNERSLWNPFSRWKLGRGHLRDYPLVDQTDFALYLEFGA